ncbi:hypothetical protein SADUNF_Sadunf18G0112300 [Salix dunnii]|uniref:Uncharacterized protein n=1 Tax=Salix dunnii TaxID=1413687 RepID=A0A835J901_9ROSI|nr:hypothetical protein SADUNF_Sadunf18G0112300 [Salix dunnii]
MHKWFWFGLMEEKKASANFCSNPESQLPRKSSINLIPGSLDGYMESSKPLAETVTFLELHLDLVKESSSAGTGGTSEAATATKKTVGRLTRLERGSECIRHVSGSAWHLSLNGSGGPLADFTEDIFPLLITYTVQKSGAPLDTLPGTSPVLNFLLRDKNITEATERKEQLFGLGINLFAIRSCNLITDFIDGDFVSTCNRNCCVAHKRQGSVEN